MLRDIVASRDGSFGSMLCPHVASQALIEATTGLFQWLPEMRAYFELEALWATGMLSWRDASADTVAHEESMRP
jgi:hypothetical protein